MKKKIGVFIACLACLVTTAQQTTTKKYRFESINSIGILNGDHDISAILQTVNGFIRGSWFAGIGTGIDYYQYRSVPIFADLRFDFAKKSRTRYFAYADGGMNLTWAEDYLYDEPSIWNPASNDFKNGMYMDLGLGIKAGFKNGNAFILSAGYSRKTMKEIISHADWRTGEPATDVNTYKFNRIVVKLGFKFG